MNVAIVGIVSRCPVVASREQYWPVGSSHSCSSSASVARKRSTSADFDRRVERAGHPLQRLVRGDEERVERDVLDEHRRARVEASQVESVALDVVHEREHPEAVVVAQALCGRGVPRVAPEHPCDT